jgi:hypothetical protein
VVSKGKDLSLIRHYWYDGISGTRETPKMNNLTKYEQETIINYRKPRQMTDEQREKARQRIRQLNGIQ